jgi:hypothetical protein
MATRSTPDFNFARTTTSTPSLRMRRFMFVPDGAGTPAETRNWDPQTRMGPVNLPWNAMSFVLGGKRYTVAYLDQPRKSQGGEIQ